MSSRVPPGALDNLRVLDLAGPIGWYASRLFADLGADVLRGRSDSDPISVRSAWWFNLGKRRLDCDLTTTAGRDRLRGLITECDIVVESFAPGWLDQWELGYRQLTELNPRLILTSVTPFGQTGPRAHWRGTDMIGLATGGLAAVAGCPGSPPNILGAEQGYFHSGVVAAVSTLIALVSRNRTGQGQHIDVSLQDTIVSTLENSVGITDLMGHARARIGDRFFAGDRLFFKALDGWIVARIGRRWEDYLRWLEENGVSTERYQGPEWQELAYQNAHLAEVNEGVKQVAARSPMVHFTEGAQRNRFVAAPVATVADVLSDVQLVARDFWLDIEGSGVRGEGPGAGNPVLGAPGSEVRIQGAPFKMSRTPWRVRGAGTDVATTWRELPTHGDFADRNSAFSLQPSALPLTGLRVLDLSWVIAGPAATQVLADHGADVLKIESAIRPDSLRVQPLPRPPWHDGLNESGIFNLINSSKRSVALDLRTEGGQRIIREILRVADVVVDNYGVDPFPKWGFTLEEIRSINPDAIIARSSVMGRSGPRTRFVGLGYTIGPNAGLNSLTGFPGDPPVGPCTAHPDYSSNPNHLLVAVLAALYYRDQTGEGQEIDLSQHESTVVFNGPVIGDYSLSGRIPVPNQNRHPAMAPHALFPCRGEDRWVAVACETDADWQRLASVIGRPDLADDVRFAGAAERKANEAMLDPIIASWTRLRTPLEAAEQLQAAGVPAGPVAGARELLRDPHLRTRGRFTRVRHPEVGWTSLPGPSFRLSATPGAIQRHPPLLGQDTDDVLRDLLGYDDEALAMAYVDEVIL